MTGKTYIGFNRAQRTLLTMAAFVVVIAGMRAAQAILVPFLLSLFIAIISNPYMNWLRSKRIPTVLAIVIVILVIIAAGGGVAALVGSSLNDFAESLPEYQSRLYAKTADFIRTLEDRGFTISEQLIFQYVDPGAAMRFTSRLLTGLGNVLGDTFLILLAVIFMLLETATFSDKLKKALNNPVSSLDRYRPFFANINRYMVIKTWTSLATGIIATLWLTLLGVDYALLWGLLTFMLNYIPNIGSIMAAIPPVLLALIQLGPWWSVSVAIGYLVLNTVIGSFLEPRIMGRGLGLSTLVVFLSLLFWGWVLGPVGMILSVPLTMTLKIALSSFNETQWISTLLDAAPVVMKSKSAD